MTDFLRTNKAVDQAIQSKTKQHAGCRQPYCHIQYQKQLSYVLKQGWTHLYSLPPLKVDPSNFPPSSVTATKMAQATSTKPASSSTKAIPATRDNEYVGSDYEIDDYALPADLYRQLKHPKVKVHGHKCCLSLKRYNKHLSCNASMGSVVAHLRPRNQVAYPLSSKLVHSPCMATDLPATWARAECQEDLSVSQVPRPMYPNQLGHGHDSCSWPHWCWPLVPLVWARQVLLKVFLSEHC